MTNWRPSKQRLLVSRFKTASEKLEAMLNRLAWFTTTKANSRLLRSLDFLGWEEFCSGSPRIEIWGKVGQSPTPCQTTLSLVAAYMRACLQILCVDEQNLLCTSWDGRSPMNTGIWHLPSTMDNIHSTNQPQNGYPQKTDPLAIHQST